MIVLVDNQRFTFSPSSCVPVTDPAVARKAPPMPDEDSDDEENQIFEPEGDCVPGRKLVSNTEDTLSKTNLKGWRHKYFCFVKSSVFLSNLQCLKNKQRKSFVCMWMTLWCSC